MSYNKFQEYLLTQDKESFFKKLLFGTEDYYYFRLIQAITKHGVQLPLPFSKELQQLKTNFTTNLVMKNMDFRFQLLKLQKAKKKEAKQVNFLQQISRQIAKKIFFIDFTHLNTHSYSNVNQKFDLKEQKVLSFLDQKKVNEELLLENYLKSDKDFQKINFSQTFFKLNPSKIPVSNLKLCRFYVRSINKKACVIKGLQKFLVDYMKQEQKVNKNFSFDNVIYQSLSLQQMIALKKLQKYFQNDVNFQKSLFCKYWSQDISHQKTNPKTPQQYKQRISRLKLMKTWVQKQMSLHCQKSLSFQYLMQILFLSLNQGQPQFDLFQQFLNHSMYYYDSMMNQQYLAKRTRMTEDKTWYHCHNIPQNHMKQNEALINSYLQEYFYKNDKIEPFNKYFKIQLLNKILHKCRLYRGHIIQNISQYFSSTQLNEIQNSKLISLLEKNKDYFEPNQQVVIYVQTKNIPKLTVKVFEIDMPNYYKKHQNQLDQNVSLQGLIASYQQIFLYSQSPVIKCKREFKFKKIIDQRGVYIIDFIGNGISSRAIIKKGKLLLKQKLTVVGHVFTIYNDNFQICKGNTTGILIRQKFYSANQQGKIIVPYKSPQLSCKALAIHQSMAQLNYIKIKQQNYDLDCVFIKLQESFILSNKSKILIRPLLKLNGIICPFDLIKQASCDVITTSDTGINSTTNHNKIKLSYQNEYEVEVQILGKLRRIEIILKLKIKTLQDNEKILQAKDLINLETNENNNFFCSQFLRLTNQGYEILILGKNGQPKANIILNISLFLQSLNTPLHVKLKTTEQGIIKLGKIESVFKITSQSQHKGDILTRHCIWNLRNNQELSLPNKIKFVEGQEFLFNYIDKQIGQNKVLLYRLTQNNIHVVEKIEGKMQLKENVLVLSGLRKGHYILNYISYKQQCYIEVIQGKRLNNKGNILTKKYLYEIQQNDAILNLKNVKIQEAKQHFDVNINLNSSQKSTRVHVEVSTFLQQEQNFNYSKLNLQTTKFSQKIINTQPKKNTYLSNKQLGDQVKYIIQRKNQKRFIGNNLEKPGLLLARQFVQDTKQIEQQFAPQKPYLNVQSKFNQQEQIQKQYGEGFDNIHRAMKGKKKKMSGGGGMCSIKYDYQQYQTNNQPIISINTFMNFLKLPGLFLNNLIPDQNRNIMIQIPKGYSILKILAINNKSCIMKIYTLPRTKIQSRNMTHKQDVKLGQFYSIKRRSIPLYPDSILQCSDITSTQLQIIDSKSKLMKAIKQLLKSYGKNIEKFQFFLFQWNKMQLNQKQLKYDENICNQLNLFLFFNDAAFFADYIRPFLKNKYQKSFIDHFLLANQNELNHYIAVNQFYRLSNLEQVLLLYYLKEKKRQQQSQQLFKIFQMKSKLIKVSSKTYKSLFDTVLNTKSTEGIQSQFQQVHHVQNFEMQQRDINLMAAPCTMANRNVRLSDMNEQCYNQNNQMDDNYMQERNRVTLIKGFSGVHTTKEYKEKTWEYLPKQHYSITENDTVSFLFYFQFAKWIVSSLENKAFLPQSLIYMQNQIDAMLALTLIDLPYEGKCETVESKDKSVKIKSHYNAIAFMKQLRQAQKGEYPLSVFQRFLDYSNRYVQDESEGILVEKKVQTFIINKIYGCKVIVTNSTVSKIQVEVLVQVPRGSIPVNTVQYTKSHDIVLDGYQTKTFQYYFYFPTEGQFAMYPANVSRAGKIVATAQSSKLKVIKEFTQIDENNFNQIVQQGTKKDIIKFISSKNILNPQFFYAHLIVKLLFDQEFYLELVDVLRKRNIYLEQIWTYSFYHGDLSSIKQFLSQPSKKKIITEKCNIKYFKSTLILIQQNEFLEYIPLINSRTHSLFRQKTSILNIQLKTQYQHFIKFLVQKQKLQVGDMLGFVYYLLLQDRIEDAVKIFKKILNPGHLQLQYDYFAGYLDFFDDYPNFTRARQIVQNYLQYPIISWRNMFYQMANQLAQFDGQQVKELVGKKKKIIQNEQVLQVELENKKINICYKNISVIKIFYYAIDLQLLFSRNPFINVEQDFSYIKPNEKEVIVVEKNNNVEKKSINLPENFLKQNFFIVITGGMKRQSLNYFSCSLKIEINQLAGQVKITDLDSKPLCKTYVKALAKGKDGIFYHFKDGYTDLRGRFNYAEKTTSNLEKIQKFSIFVMSDEHGSLIKQVGKPSEMGQLVRQKKLISKDYQGRAEQINRQNQIHYVQQQGKMARNAWCL